MAQKDLAEKQLEKLNDVFADMANGALFKGERVIRENDLTDTATESVYTSDGSLKNQFRDVAKLVRTGRWMKSEIRMIMIANENQMIYDRDMPLRVIGYDGSYYRSQYKKKRKVLPLTLVWNFGLHPWGKNRSIYDVYNVPEDLKPFVSDYRINVIDVGRMSDEEVNRYHSDFRFIAEYARHRKDPGRFSYPQKPFDHPEETLYALSVLSGNSKITELAEKKGKEIRNMDQFIEYFENRGKTKGMADERQRADLEHIIHVMQSFHVSFIEAVKGLHIPENKWDTYRKKLNIRN